MLERKLIRHPYGHEEVLIVNGAVLRQHDLPLPFNEMVASFGELILKWWDLETNRNERIRQSILRRRVKLVPNAV
jgi:hypothetical protein